MSLVRACALIAVLPLLGGCIVGYAESSQGTIVYPPETVATGSPDSFGTEAPKPTGAAARTYYDDVPDDPYLHAVRCAGSQEKLLRLNTYMVTRQNLHDMQDAIYMWTNIAIEEGAGRNLSRARVIDEIYRVADALGGREANRIALGCVSVAE